MKIRIGFVSNSSSSSYVVIGYKFKDDKESEKEIFKAITGKDMTEDDFLDDITSERDITILRGTDSGLKDGDMVVGVAIFETSEDGFANSDEFTFEEAKTLVDDATKVLRSVVKGEPKIFVGTKTC